LDRSILAKAFWGEVVEQDPNDEPATVLLNCIRTEREQQAQGKAKKSGKRGQGKTKAKST
jgi:type I restriction enzyme S subunit